MIRPFFVCMYIMYTVAKGCPDRSSAVFVDTVRVPEFFPKNHLVA